MNTKLMFVLVAALLLAAITGCGTQNVGSAGNPDREVARFSLNVWDESYVGSASAQDFTLNVEDQGESVLVDINVDNAQDLKALYFDMAYDPALYRPMVVEPTKAMGDKSNLLQMTYLQERGKLYHGQVIANYEWREGLSGDAMVAQVLFLKQPAVNSRSISAAGPPVAPSAATTLTGTAPDTLDWRYFNTGDYDQNSEVNIADLTPLGANLGASSAPDADFDVNTAMSAIDGDFNGELNIADLTPIGANFQASCGGGYNIYESLDPADAGATPSDPNGAGATLTGTIIFADATGTAADRKAFQYTIAAPTANAYYWVRPTNGSADGIRSNLVFGNVAEAPVLAITNPPASGSGTAVSPYVCDVTTDYTFTLTDPTDGDVSGDAGTTWVVSIPASGILTAGSPTTFNFDDAFEGDISISATYNAKPSNPSAIHLRIVGVNPGGDLEINPDPADADWPAQSPADPPSGHDNPYYVLPNDDAVEFSFVADDTVGAGGAAVDVATLTWTAFPAPFLVTWVTEGTFTSNMFTNCYILAQDAVPQDSNKVYVERHDLP